MEKAKSIDELYDEVKDFDLVMCNDAPLALALNNRLDKPHVGTFAITPRQLAGDLAMDILKEPLMSDIEVVRRVSKATGYPLRFVHGEIENIKTIRRFTTDVKRYLHSWKSKEIFDEFVRLPTLEKAMDSFVAEGDPFLAGKNIAVIGGDLYDSLDKKFNLTPGKFEPIDLFSDESLHAYDIPEFRELYTDYQVAENAVSLITEETAADFAIVLDVGGRIADNVRSELYRKGIPFINDLAIRDLNNIRDFIEFLNRSHDFAITKASQIRNLLQSFGGKLKVRCDEYLIENYEEIADNDRARELFSIMENISDYTYGYICEKVMKGESAQVKLMLTQLDLYDTKVNAQDTADIVYSVDNFPLKHNEQIPKDEKKGVLIVDCKNSVYVDRPVIIYLGMGQEWEKDLSALNLIDSKFKDKETTDNTAKFQILLQQGSSRIYICNSKKKGKDAKPCRYFEYANSPDEPYKNFSAIAKCVPGAWYKYRKSREWTSKEVSPSEESKEFTFSYSSFNDYVTCPWLYVFQTTSDFTEKDSNTLGTYLHYYVEFRTCFPEESAKMGQEFFVRYISDRCTPLYSPEIRKLKESKIRFAISELDKLISGLGIVGDITFVERVKYPNPFFELVDKGNYLSNCNEVEFVNRTRHMYGKMDLVDGSDIYDFKTGSPKTVDKVLEKLKMSGKTDYGPDVQALFYMSLLDDMGVKNPSFTFYSTSANENESALGGDTDPENAMVHVRLVDDEVIIHDILPTTKRAGSKKYEKIVDRWEDFFGFMKEYGLDRILTDPADAGPYISDRFMASDKKIKDAISDLLKYVKEFVDKGLIQIDDNTIIVTKERLEKFRATVKERYDSYKSFYNKNTNKFEPLKECTNCYCKDMCTIYGQRGVVNE